MTRSLNNRGVSFVEVLAGSTVLLLMAGTLAGATVTALKQNKYSRDAAVAVALAHEWIEGQRAREPWLLADLENGAEGPLDALGGSNSQPRFFRRWTVTPDTPVEGTTLVSVAVSWGADNQHRIEAATLFCVTTTCS